MLSAEHSLGGFIIGTLIAQFAGAWTYGRAKRALALSEARAATASGIATTVVAALIYTLFRVHEWLGGQGVSWGLSVFMAICVGLVQGVLFRGRPLEPRT